MPKVFRLKHPFYIGFPLVLLLVVSLACNLPGASSTPAVESTPTVTVDVTLVDEADIASDDGAYEEPNSEEVPLDPLEILDTYASLETIRMRLETMNLSNSLSGQDLTGRELLEWILIDREYDPRDSNSDKEEIMNVLDTYIFPYPSARIFLINVATGLTVEAHGWVPWSLSDYSVDDIENLFIEDESFRTTDPTLHKGDLPQGMPNAVNHWHNMDDILIEEAHYKQFNLARRLTEGAANQQDAVAAMVVWLQQNFFHAISPGYAWDVYLDGQEPREGPGQVAFPLSLERIYEERVSGCHEPTLILEGMAHSLNIPAVRLSIHGHGVLYLPTMERFIHGDHVVAYTDAPFGSLLLTYDQILPFAQEEANLYTIYYETIYVTPFRSMPLWRDGEYLYIENDTVRNPGESVCIVIDEEDWLRISKQLSAYNLRYDTVNCVLSSDRLPILTLDELNQSD
jgi:hypothetical protein